MATLNIALQLYSVRDDMENDFIGTLEKVKEYGYDGVELAGLYGRTPEEFKQALDSVGLKAISAHVPYLELMDDLEGTVEKYVTIGCQYIAVPYLTEEYRPGTDNFIEVVENIKKIGECCNNKGITLLYHNHDFEFDLMPDGRYALDYIYETVDKKYLQTEIDTCWVKVSGINPAEYITKYTGRSPVVHLKDYVGEKSENMYELIGIDSSGEKAAAFEFRAVGLGVQDFPAIIQAAIDAGTKWVVVEQDAHYENTALEDAKISREYLTTIGY